MINKHNKKYNMIISTALAINIAALSTSTAMFSASAEEQYGKIHTVYAQNINQEVLRKLADGIDKYEFSIDIEEYNVSRKELNNITNALVLCYPELFYFTDIGVSFVGNRVLSIEVYYDYDIEEIIARRQLFNEAADSILAKVDSSMSDFEKALLLHDELAVHGTYALNRPNADDILIDRFGQCSAYTLAYSYLLSRVGVDSEIVVSNEMHHTWNKVCIDGTYYNVDVTWDDPMKNDDDHFWDIPGHVFHDYFLRSDYSFQNDSSLEPHTGYESLFESPDTYDNYSYINSTSKFCYENGKLYYIDNSSAGSSHLIEYDYRTDSSENLKDFSDCWMADERSYYSKNYMTLCSKNGILYYNGPSLVYSYDIASGEETVFSNDDALQDKCYGVVIKNGGIYAALTDNPEIEATMLYLGETINNEPTSTEPPEPLYMYGDVNRDGRLSVRDATALQFAIAELEPIDDKQRILGDVDGDEMISIKDVTQIQYRVAEIIKLFPVEESGTSRIVINHDNMNARSVQYD